MLLKPECPRCEGTRVQSLSYDSPRRNAARRVGAADPCFVCSDCNAAFDVAAVKRDAGRCAICGGANPGDATHARCE